MLLKETKIWKIKKEKEDLSSTCLESSLSILLFGTRQVTCPLKRLYCLALTVKDSIDGPDTKVLNLTTRGTSFSIFIVVIY